MNVVVTLTRSLAPSTTSITVHTLPARMSSTSRGGVGGDPAGYAIEPLEPSVHVTASATPLRCGAPGPLTVFVTSRSPTSYAVAVAWTVVETVPDWARISFCAACLVGRYTLPDGTVTAAVAEMSTSPAVAAPGPELGAVGDRVRERRGPGASGNRLPPVAVTCAGAVVFSVNGPMSEPAGPSSVGGVIEIVGGCGFTTGPMSMTCCTIAATSARRGSNRSSTYLSLKNQIAACTAAALSFAFESDAGSFVFG